MAVAELTKYNSLPNQRDPMKRQPKLASCPTASPEADRFRSFAKQIVAVPKVEIDRRAKVWGETKNEQRKATA